jgi:Tfp pilus assembly protein PilO
LTPEQKRELQETQRRLIAMLPKDKDIPPVLQEISRIARQFRLEDVTFKTGGRGAFEEQGRSTSRRPDVSQVVVSQPDQAPGSKDAEHSGPIDSFAVTVAFLGEYRATAYFLEAVQRIPRVVRIQSVKLQRQFPQVSAEVVLHVYYQKESLN